MTDDGQRSRRPLALALMFAVIAGFAAWDLITDAGSDAGPTHILTEALVLLIALAGAALMLRSLLTLARERRQLQVRLLERNAEADYWRAETRSLLDGLGAAIATQFERWKLSPAEQEVAMLLLKGLPLKQIAALRGVGDATVRQQARAVYAKAQLGGRADLAAFFLEDLLLPMDGTTKTPTP